MNFACWQLVNAAPAAGCTRIERTTIRTLKRHLKLVSATLKYGMACYLDGDHGIVCSLLLDVDKLYVGAVRDTALEEFTTTTGIDLDWL